MRGLTSQQTASAYIAEIEIGKLGGMKTYSSAAALRTAIHSARRAGKTVAFVPTRGICTRVISLVRRASREADIVVVSIVNPLQFSASEDQHRFAHLGG